MSVKDALKKVDDLDKKYNPERIVQEAIVDFTVRHLEGLLTKKKGPGRDIGTSDQPKSQGDEGFIGPPAFIGPPLPPGPKKPSTAQGPSAPRKVVASANGPASILAPPKPSDTLPNITSSNIFVDGVHFVDWFNDDFHKKFKSKKHLTKQLYGHDFYVAPTKLDKPAFVDVFDQCNVFWYREIAFPMFLGFLLVFYNETGGSLIPIAEIGSLRHLFEPAKDKNGNVIPNGKQSYNADVNSHRHAGDKLKDMGILTDPNDIAAWNSEVNFPANAPKEVMTAAKECDFHKFRGRGLIQLTWRSTYLKCVDPLLVANGYPKTCDDYTDAELTKIIFEDRRINLPMVKSYCVDPSVYPKLEALTEDPESYYKWGLRVSGGKRYGELLVWRCQHLYEALAGKKVTVTAATEATKPGAS